MDHYGKARRDGLRIYTQALQAHEDPYLPVLETRVPGLTSLSRLSLGIMAVPLSRVLGSVSEGRSKAFTKNFLPILEGGSELDLPHILVYREETGKGMRVPPDSCLAVISDDPVGDGCAAVFSFGQIKEAADFIERILIR